MKNTIEKLIKDHNNPSTKKISNTNINKCKIIFISRISIILIFIELLILLFINHKIKTEAILTIEKNKELNAINSNMQTISALIKESNTKMKMIIQKKEVLIRSKTQRKNKLNTIKGKAQELINKLEQKKNYIKLAKSISVLLRPLDLQRVEQYTHCTFMQLCYRMARDGRSAKAFHQQCDGLKPTVALIHNHNDVIFGGFTHVTWDGKGFKYDNKALLFSLFRGQKFKIIENKPAIFASPDLLPTFGEDDILISETGAYCRNPLICYEQYGDPNDEKHYFNIFEIEVFQMKCD